MRERRRAGGVRAGVFFSSSSFSSTARYSVNQKRTWLSLSSSHMTESDVGVNSFPSRSTYLTAAVKSTTGGWAAAGGPPFSCGRAGRMPWLAMAAVMRAVASVRGPSHALRPSWETLAMRETRSNGYLREAR